MDRIAALRNIETALAEFEAGEADLAGTEERVLGILRTYATEFGNGSLSAYRARGDDRADGIVVVGDSRHEARERVETLIDAAGVEFELDKVG